LALDKQWVCGRQFWLNLQSHHDLEKAEDRLGNRLADEVHALAVA